MATSSPCFAIKTNFQSESFEVSKRHLYFVNSATLTNLTILVPNPPLSFGRHTSEHFIQEIFYPSLAPLHIIFLWIETIFFRTHYIIRK
jgi:hypothetical protein